MRVQGLAKRLLTLYNVTSLAFYGHIQTCAVKDAASAEQEEQLGLGKIAAIDQMKQVQRSSRR